MHGTALQKLGSLIHFTETQKAHGPDESLAIVNAYLEEERRGDQISARAWHHYRAGERQPSRRRIRAIARYAGVPPVAVITGSYEIGTKAIWYRD